MRISRSVLWFLVALGVAAGFAALLPRLHAERQNRSVDVVLDAHGLLDFCDAEGVDVAHALRRFKEAGVTAMAYPEVTVEHLRTRGRASYYAGIDFAKALRAHLELLPAGVARADDVHTNPSHTYVEVYEPSLLTELQDYLRLVLGSDRPRFAVWPSPQAAAEASPTRPGVLDVATSDKTLMETGLGFTHADLAMAQNAGLGVWLRPENRDQFQDKDVQAYFALLARLRHYGVQGVVFSGATNEVLGYPESLDATVESMKAQGLLFGNIEAPTADAQQKGSQTLGTRLATQTVRVMSFSPAFMAKLTPTDAVDKFVLGVRERNIRVCYLRFFATPDPGKSLMDTNLDYIRQLAAQLRARGFHTGAARPFPPIAPRLWMLMLMALGVAAATIMLLQSWMEIPRHLDMIALVGAPCIMAALHVIHRDAFGMKIAALVAALVFAVLGIVCMLEPLTRRAEKATSPTQALGGAALSLAGMTGLSVAGGVMVAGLLAATPFMLSVEQFRGIKLIMLVPPLVAVLYYVTRRAPEPTTIRRMLASAVQFWHLGALVVLLGAGAFFVIRTGNAAPGAAPDWEIHLRNLLENVFVARPRFKEFALGHPAWMLAGLLLYRQRGVRMLWLLVAAAAIGQADIVDTFAHVHTPWLISLLRIANGLWLGVLVGFLVGWGVQGILGQGNRNSEARNTSSPG